MDKSFDQQAFRRQADTYRLALLFSQKAVTCLSASIDACDNNDKELAEHFSKMALRHTLQVEAYLSTSFSKEG